MGINADDKEVFDDRMKWWHARPIMVRTTPNRSCYLVDAVDQIGIGGWQWSLCTLCSRSWIRGVLSSAVPSVLSHLWLKWWYDPPLKAHSGPLALQNWFAEGGCCCSICVQSNTLLHGCMISSTDLLRTTIMLQTTLGRGIWSTFSHH